ncbi:hypothetical protein BKA82DRAFT_4018947 [Pisolithus tinctorius]|nr:hypothetical protein BKA82DRAFT_4018947 [Pisolithus tinctorius]
MTLQICTPRFFKTANPPEIKKDKPKPQHAVQPPEGWEEHMFGLCDRRRSLTPSVSVSSQNSTTLILQEDQVEGAPMEEDTDEAEAEAEEVEVNIPADEGSQCPDDGASQLPDDEDEDDSESSLPPSLPPAEDSSSDTEDEFPPCHPGCHVEHKPKSKGKSRAMDVDNSDIASQDDHEHAQNAKFRKTGNLSHAALDEIHDFMTKSPHDILVTAGLSVKPSHMKLNKANLFCSWYWATQPKPDGEYNQLMKDIPKDDTMARKEKLKAIYEWSKSSSAVPANKSVKSITVRVYNMKMQFSRLDARPLAYLVVLISYVQKYINDCAIDVWGLMDKYTAIFKCLRDGNGTEAGIGVALLNEGDTKRSRCKNTQEPSQSEHPLLAWHYGDLHCDAVQSHSHPQDPGPSQQFPPSQHYEDVLRDPHYDCANYHDPGPSDVPYNVLLPACHSLGHFPLSCQTYCIPSHPDHHVYHDAPYISDYYPPAQPTAQQWVDRGSAAQYEDEFPEDYLDY